MLGMNNITEMVLPGAGTWGPCRYVKDLGLDPQQQEDAVKPNDDVVRETILAAVWGAHWAGLGRQQQGIRQSSFYKGPGL